MWSAPGWSGTHARSPTDCRRVRGPLKIGERGGGGDRGLRREGDQGGRGARADDRLLALLRATGAVVFLQLGGRAHTGGPLSAGSHCGRSSGRASCRGGGTLPSAVEMSAWARSVIGAGFFFFFGSLLGVKPHRRRRQVAGLHPLAERDAGGLAQSDAQGKHRHLRPAPGRPQCPRDASSARVVCKREILREPAGSARAINSPLARPVPRRRVSGRGTAGVIQ